MSRRERILTTLDHREPDRVPFSFDMWPQAEAALCAYYGVADLEGLYRKIGVDCFSVWMPTWAAMPRYVGPPRQGLGVHDSTYGCWGKVGERIYPLAGNALDEYRWPAVEDFDFSRLADDLAAIREMDRTAASGHASPGWLHHVQLRSYDHALLDVLDDGWMSEYMARNRAFFIPYFETLFAHADGLIDIIRADEDLGGHDNMLISPRLWRRWYKPLWADIFAICHRHGARVWLHSCGFCRSVVPDFIDMGADILNPIPPYVRGSDPLDMKQTFGDRLVLDGGVDQMRVLTQGTPDEVRAEVRRRIAELAPGGGYLLGPSQVITEDVPLENLVAMLEEGLAAGQYHPTESC
jgi:uroporphyrinogen decarboxylase